MISAWRIDKAHRSAADAFSGEGGIRSSGRWNQAGTRIVYASGSLSLAALEKFIHIGDDGRDIKLVAYEAVVPAGVEIRVLKLKDMPPVWKDVPAPRSTMDIGTKWISSSSTAVLKVPSVVIEAECNFLLNPLHPDFKKIRISAPSPFRFDNRMWDK